RPDLVVPNHDTKGVTVLLARPGGGFVPGPRSPVQFPEMRPHVHHLALHDLDRDGEIDLVLPDWGNNRVLVARGDGKGAFSPDARYATGQMPYYNVAVADLDGDQRPDVVAPNHEGASLSVLRGAGRGKLDPATSIAVPQRPFWVAIGDVDGNGKADLLVA